MVFNLRTYSFSESVEDDPTPPKSFSLKELRVATYNFSRGNILAETVLRKVYRGCLADGSLVAVKRGRHADRWTEDCFEAEKQVGCTVSMHPNVLCLRGFCRTKKELLLVYPLMINNTLSYNLRERPDRFARPLDWTTRKQIALGVARGLAHLHNQGNIKIMHRGICASNILLNVHFEAMIGGFSHAMIMHEGNAKEGTIKWRAFSRRRFRELFYETYSPAVFQTDYRYEDVYVDTRRCGTFGFIAPEYFYTGKCTLKNDVFAYGRMLLELISGQPIEPDGLADNENLTFDPLIGDFMYNDELERVIDPNLQGNYVEEEAKGLLQLASLCSDEDPSTRPEMSEVVRMLESQFLQRDPSTRSSWSQSECDSTPYYSFPPSPSPSPSPLGIAP
ncbi:BRASSINOSTEROID INSENSITIVE 1-associated receptor kinase 1-like [Syzygium oleosum]|uniref:BRASSINOSTEROID INSENSITIVE 1-associated receptor kinase 1-like n=1 Tax=Syzygium oleosum TaxID=219896 RepID=UPI0011D19E1D|nr:BRASSINOSTEROID INSENSITIVE 1-associated receptor kinase 1-like [Syzygium oleosum]